MTNDNAHASHIPSDPLSPLNGFLRFFEDITDPAQIVQLWNQIPVELEQPFLSAVETRIAEAEHAGATKRAEGLRHRLDELHRMLDLVQTAFARIVQGVAQLEITTSDEAAAAIWNEIPIELEESFLTAAERRSTELSDPAIAARMRGHIAQMRQSREARQQAGNLPPVVRAFQEFLHASSDDAARQVFASHRSLLQPYEAQRMANELVERVPNELREHLAERIALLRELRGGVAQPGALLDATASAEPLLRPSTDTNRFGMAQASDGGTATVYNITNINLLQRSWNRRRPPALQREVVTRPHELAEVRTLLQTHGGAVIGARTLGVQGMPGVGKTTLANILALDLDQAYPDGVLWEVIGPEIRTPDQVQVILDRWGLLAVGVEFDPKAPPRFEVEAVRALLGEHPRLLVVLDNFWSKDAIAPLRAALPPEAHLLITTRSRQLLTQLQIPSYLLDVLRREDALALAELRLGWKHGIPASEIGWIDTLITAVGHHTLALDVALGMLTLQSDDPAEWATDAARIGTFIKTGVGFAEIQLGADDREHHVELVLRYSYDHALNETDQQRFRMLGAFAPDAEFSTPYAAILWGCDEEEARRQLNRFVNAALLSRGGRPGQWQQHALLRGYALALQQRTGEYEMAASRHAQSYGKAMGQADDRQQFHIMLSELPQLRHAFAWAIANDLSQAQQLIGDSAELQSAFGLAREGLAWCKQALASAHQRGTSADMARAWVSLGGSCPVAVPRWYTLTNHTYSLVGGHDDRFSDYGAV